MKCNHNDRCHDDSDGSRHQKAQDIFDRFFEYVDGRKGVDEVLPKRAREDLHFIMFHLSPRLEDAIHLKPCDPLRAYWEPKEFYTYAWNEFWKYAPTIRNRSISGVCHWLLRVIRNKRIRLRQKIAPQSKTFIPLSNVQEDSYAWLHYAGLANSDADYAYRFQLLHEFYLEGLKQLAERQRMILELSEEHSHAEIMQQMAFVSLDAVKAFKKRARRALEEAVLRLFRRDLAQNSSDLKRREAIEEWLERFDPK